MNKPTILIVDDQKAIHIVLKAMLSREYTLEFASDAQEAIDLLSEKPVHLILLDIQMPELSGLELLESMMIDTALHDVPVIIITGKATEERKNQANHLGAVGFVCKDDLLDEAGKQSIFDLIKKNVNASIPHPNTESDHKNSGKIIIKSLLNDAKKKDFFFAARRLGLKLMNNFQIEYVSFWSIQKGRPNMLISLGDMQPPDFGPEEIKSEPAFKTLYVERSPYLTNNATSQKTGIFASLAMENGLSSEIGIPLFKLNRQTITKNRMKVPKNTPIYGFIILKRNRVFSSREYKFLIKTNIFCGSILWTLFQNIFKK